MGTWRVGWLVHPRGHTGCKIGPDEAHTMFSWLTHAQGRADLVVDLWLLLLLEQREWWALRSSLARHLWTRWRLFRFHLMPALAVNLTARENRATFKEGVVVFGQHVGKRKHPVKLVESYFFRSSRALVGFLYSSNRISHEFIKNWNGNRWERTIPGRPTQIKKFACFKMKLGDNPMLIFDSEFFHESNQTFYHSFSGLFFRP